MAEEKEVAATIESTTTTSTIKTTSDSLEKALEATTSETSSTESGSASQSSASQHRKEIETEETSLKAQTTSTVLTGMIGTSQWSLDPTSGELTIGPGVLVMMYHLRSTPYQMLKGNIFWTGESRKKFKKFIQ